MMKEYAIEPKYKKSVYEKEEWCNKLKNGKSVSVYITTYYRYGTFNVKLSNIDKQEITNNDEIILNNYEDFEMNELIDGCSLDIDIANESSYTNDEINEISKLIYCYNNEKDVYDAKLEGSEEESEEENEFDICEFENNGWDHIESEHGIIGGCIITNTV